MPANHAAPGELTTYVFAGPSGAGKSTVSTLSPGATVLSDDLVALRQVGGRYHLYGTPFYGSIATAVRCGGCVPLVGFYMLVQAPHHAPAPLAPAAALAQVVAATPFVTTLPAWSRSRRHRHFIFGLILVFGRRSLLDIIAELRIHPQVAARLLEGRASVVLADVGEVLVLNPSGAALWQQIDGRRTVVELAARLAAGHGLDPASAQQDTARFVQSLIEAGAVHVPVTLGE